MKETIKYYTIRIPKIISIYYSEQHHFLVVAGPMQLSSLKLATRLNINYRTKSIKITEICFKSISRNNKKKIRNIQGNYHSKIKQTILVCYSRLCKKLKLVGVGYKALLLEKSGKNMLHLKLGYSHDIFIKLSSTLHVQCFRASKIYIIGNLYKEVLQLAASIRSYKKPEPYKGKGVLYLSERINLKKGKIL